MWTEVSRRCGKGLDPNCHVLKLNSNRFVQRFLPTVRFVKSQSIHEITVIGGNAFDELRALISWF